MEAGWRSGRCKVAVSGRSESRQLYEMARMEGRFRIQSHSRQLFQKI